MKLPKSAHTDRPWRIHEIAPDFRVEDVWAMPTPGSPDDFPRLMRQFAAADIGDSSSVIVRALFAIRWKLGALLGWDEDTGAQPILPDRLPADLRDGPAPTALSTPMFTPVFETENEWAAEAVNRTMRGVLHLGWVQDDETGGYRGQLAVLVRPNGLLGKAYMAGIAPFRHLIVYPTMMRSIGREWAAGASATTD